MHSARKPWWQQVTALVTVSTGGVITGFTFVPGAAATMTSPTSVPLHLMALEQAAKPGRRRRRRAALGHRQRRELLPPAGAGQDPGPDGGDHLGARQRGRRRPRRVLRRVRQPDAGAGRAGGRASRAGSPAARRTRGRCRSGPTSGSTPIRPRRASPRCSRTLRRITAGIRSATATSHSPATGCCSTATSRSSPATPTVRWTRSGPTRCPNLSVNAHSYPDPLAQQGVEGLSTTASLAETTAASGQRPRRGARCRSRELAPRAVRGRPLSRRRPPSPASWRQGPAPAPGSGYVPVRASRTGQRRAVPRQARPLRAPREVPPRRPRRTSRAAAVRRRAGGRRAASRPARGTAAPSRTSAPYRQHTAPADCHAGDENTAGVHQPDRARCPRRPAAVRRAGLRHHRAGHRRVRVGN